MRIDAYMQVSQIYQANKTKNAPKTGKAGSRDSLEISSFGNAYQVAKQAASQGSDVREDKVKEIQAQMAAGTYSVSIEDVASSRIITGGLATAALAIDISCLCPCERLAPFCVSTV